MVYARSRALDGLHYVVLDEVHFLQDAYRGPVWEEVLIHTPPGVDFVCLSATVSNADELGAWIADLRGPTATVVEHERPIRLDSLYLVGDRSAEREHLVPLLVDGRPNPEGHRFDADSPRSAGPRPHHRRRRFFTPRRLETIERLAERGAAPGDLLHLQSSRVRRRRDALPRRRRCVSPTASERRRIREIAEERTATLSDGDLDVLGYDRWIAALEMGIAAHHAGMIPAFREAVEECFNDGLVRAVFATETLALGINMPARSVVIERLTKFNGDTPRVPHPGSVHPVDGTGRPPRQGQQRQRGGAVVTVHHVQPGGHAGGEPGVPTHLRVPAHLQHGRPTWCTATTARPRTRSWDDRSRSSRPTGRRSRSGVAPTGWPTSSTSSNPRRHPIGSFDVEGYVALEDLVRSLRRARPGGRAEIEDSLAALRPGDVVERTTDRGRRALLVLSVAHRGAGAVRVRAVTAQGQQVSLQLSNVREPIARHRPRRPARAVPTPGRPVPPGGGEPAATGEPEPSPVGEAGRRSREAAAERGAIGVPRRGGAARGPPAA